METPICKDINDNEGYPELDRIYQVSIPKYRNTEYQENDPDVTCSRKKVKHFDQEPTEFEETETEEQTNPQLILTTLNSNIKQLDQRTREPEEIKTEFQNHDKIPTFVNSKDIEAINKASNNPIENEIRADNTNNRIDQGFHSVVLDIENKNPHNQTNTSLLTSDINISEHFNKSILDSNNISSDTKEIRIAVPVIQNGTFEQEINTVVPNSQIKNVNKDAENDISNPNDEKKSPLDSKNASFLGLENFQKSHSIHAHQETYLSSPICKIDSDRPLIISEAKISISELIKSGNHQNTLTNEKFQKLSLRQDYDQINENSFLETNKNGSFNNLPWVSDCNNCHNLGIEKLQYTNVGTEISPYSETDKIISTDTDKNRSHLALNTQLDLHHRPSGDTSVGLRQIKNQNGVNYDLNNNHELCYNINTPLIDYPNKVEVPNPVDNAGNQENLNYLGQLTCPIDSHLLSEIKQNLNWNSFDDKSAKLQCQQERNSENEKIIELQSIISELNKNNVESLNEIGKLKVKNDLLEIQLACLYDDESQRQRITPKFLKCGINEKLHSMINEVNQVTKKINLWLRGEQSQRIF